MEGKTMGVKVLGISVSPFVLRARIALNLKAVEYEFLLEKPGFKSQLLLQSNPIHKKIPVLIHQDKSICESLIIVHYIDETWSSPPSSILPSLPFHRATARFWAAYVEDLWAPTLDTMRGVQGEAREAALEKQREVLATLEDAFLKCSEGKGFFGGERIGLVDIAFGSFLGWLRAAEIVHRVNLIDASTTPELSGWAERFCVHSCVKDVMPDTEEILEFSKHHLQAAVKSD